MKESRAEVRKVIICSVQVEFKTSNGFMRLPGLMEDRSQSGAAIRIAKPLKFGATVRVVGPKQNFTAEVRNCRRDGFDYVLGLRLQESPADAPAQPQPAAQVNQPPSKQGVRAS